MSAGELVDVEMLIVGHLRADAGVLAVTDEASIATELPPGFDADPPFAVISRLPGIHEDRETGRLERCRLNGETWATTKLAAFDLAKAVIVALFTLRTTDHALGVVTNVELEQSPWWDPDPDTALPRYIFGFAAWVHPL